MHCAVCAQSTEVAVDDGGALQEHPIDRATMNLRTVPSGPLALPAQSTIAPKVRSSDLLTMLLLAVAPASSLSHPPHAASCQCSHAAGAIRSCASSAADVADHSALDQLPLRCHAANPSACRNDQAASQQQPQREQCRAIGSR